MYEYHIIASCCFVKKSSVEQLTRGSVVLVCVWVIISFIYSGRQSTHNLSVYDAPMWRAHRPGLVGWVVRHTAVRKINTHEIYIYIYTCREVYCNVFLLEQKVHDWKKKKNLLEIEIAPSARYNIFFFSISRCCSFSCLHHVSYMRPRVHATNEKEWKGKIYKTDLRWRVARN